MTPPPAAVPAAVPEPVPDVLGPDLDVLFCGINPGLYSAATGHHFARPGNRFWPALHQSGFTPRQLHPAEQDDLLALGLGITNLVARPTARAEELSADELRSGARRLTEVVTANHPRYVAIVGITAYRTAFARPRAGFGEQPDRVGGARLWVLPNPSGLNAHYPLPALAAAFRELRERIGEDTGPPGDRGR